MPGKRILSDLQIEEMAELYEAGWTYARIAEHFTRAGTPIHAATLHWQCMRVGADAPPHRWRTPTQPAAPYSRGGRVVRPYTADDDALLNVLDQQGFAYAVIARRMGRKPNSIKGRLMTLARRDARAEALHAGAAA